jgi:Asp-tRNA(Asn)/Glu-tRNA(Gln) amidotransferase C subunit
MTDYTTTIHREQPAVSVAAVLEENKKLKIENAALEKFCGQLSEIIDRLSATTKVKKHER